MDENHLSEDENNSKDGDNNNLNKNRNSKRIKVQHGPSNNESTSSCNVKENLASTSNSVTPVACEDSPSIKMNSFRNRNYRNSHMDDDTESNTSEEDSPSNIVNDEDSDSSAYSPVHLSDSPYSSPEGEEEISETESETSDKEIAAVASILGKVKPKHTWWVVPAVVNRQFGYSAKMHSANLFQNRCYGSLNSVQRLELMYKLKEHKGCVNCLNFYPDGSMLVSGSDDLYIAVWDWKLGKCLFKYHSKHQANVFQSKFMHLQGDLHIATCSRDRQVRIARVSREGGVRENRKLGAHKAACHKLIILRDQPHIILSAGEDGVVLRHDVRTNQKKKVLMLKVNNKTVPLYSIHGHPLRSHEFCIAGQDSAVHVFDQRKSSKAVSTHHPFKMLLQNSSTSRDLPITAACYNYDGSEILASYNDENIYLFDVNAECGTYLHQYEGHRNETTIKGVSFFGPKSEFIVSGSDCGNIFFWEKNTEAIVQFMAGDDGGVVNCLEPHPTLPFICTSGLDWDVKVWVPSYEQEPSLEDLARTIRKNKRALRDHDFDLESRPPILWMLYQHLQQSSRFRRHGGDESSDNSDGGLNFNEEDMSGDCPTS